jgi:hypothetical protein
VSVPGAAGGRAAAGDGCCGAGAVAGVHDALRTVSAAAATRMAEARMFSLLDRIGDIGRELC